MALREGGTSQLPMRPSPSKVGVELGFCTMVNLCAQGRESYCALSATSPASTHFHSVVQQYEARFVAMDVGIVQTDRGTK